MSSEEHGDKWWLSKSVDETTEYLGSAPGSTGVDGVVTKTFVGGSNSSLNFADNTYSANDRRGSSGGGILKSSRAYVSEGKDCETRKRYLQRRMGKNAPFPKYFRVLLHLFFSRKGPLPILFCEKF